MNFEEWKKAKISREEENSIPQFSTHTEARTYFKNLYGVNFQMQDSQENSGEKIYLYHLILDMSQYMDAIKEINENQIRALQWTEENCLADRYMFSHQAIEISEDGNVNITH